MGSNMGQGLTYWRYSVRLGIWRDILRIFEYFNTTWQKKMDEWSWKKGNKIAIFDILPRRADSGYSATVYRKPAASDRYRHYTSAQAWKEKVSAIHTQKSWPYVYCREEEYLAKERSHIILYGEYYTKTKKKRKRKENWTFLKPFTHHTIHRPGDFTTYPTKNLDLMWFTKKQKSRGHNTKETFKGRQIEKWLRKKMLKRKRKNRMKPVLGILTMGIELLLTRRISKG